MYKISDNATRRPTQEYYALELGVDKPGEAWRVCALEAGPFADIREARDFARSAKGKGAGDLIREYPKLVHAYDLPQDEIEDRNYPVVGVTFSTNNDDYGTLSQHDLY